LNDNEDIPRDLVTCVAYVVSGEKQTAFEHSYKIVERDYTLKIPFHAAEYTWSLYD